MKCRALAAFVSACLLVVAIALVDWRWMSHGVYSIDPNDIHECARELATLTIGTLLLFAVASLPRYRALAQPLRLREASIGITWIVLMLAFGYVAVIFQYLCVTLNAPLLDSTLVAFDRGLGFDWLGLYRWETRHGMVFTLLNYIYLSYLPQIVLTLLILCLCRQTARAAEFALLFMLSALGVTLISARFPASSPWLHFGLVGHYEASAVSYLYPLRDGLMKVLRTGHPQGLVSVPSLHTIAAVLLVYAVRGLPWLLPFSAMLNVAMIFSALVTGGHYLADIIAGLAFVTPLVLAARGVERISIHGRHRPWAVTR